MTSLQDSVKKYCNERGVNKTSLHLFRHTFITNAVNQNVNPLLLQRITGHSTLKELNRYYNAKTIDLVDVIDGIAPKISRKQFNPLDTLLSSSKKERISMKIKSRAD